MITINITDTPNSVYDTFTSTTEDIKSLVGLVGKEVWAGCVKQSKEFKSPLAMAFAEVTVDGVYDDELSGALTVALDAAIAPKRKKPKRIVHAAPKVDNVTPAAARAAVKAVMEKKPSKAVQVRTLIKDNPALDADALIALVVEQGLLPLGKAKVYVKENIVRVRG